MPGFLLHQGATILCAHAGQVTATAPNPRVKVMGQMVVTQAAWVTAAFRVKVMGQPVLLQDSQAVCAPNGTPINIVLTQLRVKGQ
jgi:uncharacterized Zn-binding protein involved in type VI secretion